MMVEDKGAIAERLRAETDLQADSDVLAYAGTPGEPPPPDVVLYLLHTLIPVADIYANVLASAICDRVRSAFGRRGRDDGVTFRLVEADDDENPRRELRGETRNPEAIAELIRQFGKDQQ